MTEIVARGRVFFAGGWGDLPVQPKFHSLLTAPTGTGKTAVATMAATELGAKLLRISAPGWIPASGRGAVKETISVIAEAVARNERTLLAIDEICKIQDRDGDNSWKSYCRGELYDLADGRWPTGLKPPEDDDEPLIGLDDLTKKLRETVFILGIGTFQDWFDSTGTRRSIGFGAENNTADEISAEDIAERLPRELLNRFNNSLVRLPELQAEHYLRIARQAEESLPERMRQAFAAAVAARIGGAISAKKGVRFLEEAMLDTLKNLPPEPKFELVLRENCRPEPDPFDLCTL